MEGRETKEIRGARGAFPIKERWTSKKTGRGGGGGRRWGRYRTGFRFGGFDWRVHRGPGSTLPWWVTVVILLSAATRQGHGRVTRPSVSGGAWAGGG